LELSGWAVQTPYVDMSPPRVYMAIYIQFVVNSFMESELSIWKT